MKKNNAKQQGAVPQQFSGAQIIWPLSREQQLFFILYRKCVDTCKSSPLNWLIAFIQWFLVVPATNFTNTSLFYQMYLNRIVHQSPMYDIAFYSEFSYDCSTMAIHHVCSPLILVFAFALIPCVMGTSVSMVGYPIHATFIGAIFLSPWYIVWGVLGRGKEYLPLLGV